MKRAIENIVGNAVKYGRPDTPIRIKTDSLNERLLLSAHNEGNSIPSDQVKDIFQVFRRAGIAKEGNKEGLGYRLAVCLQCRGKHGGSVGVDSGVNRGTTFIINIPLDSRAYQDAPALERKLD
ncbi:HAMP domain-containing sensor histidine kinase [Nitrosospira sp. Is2]|uniref:sensor histidine kinase n=1 Tax=Nitrosospira sp. Is2 TaxID=3080532 RepID=UPI002952AD89|nr:HAMP domain-containing sensor histidine kinase [Nitrosospira sp. Is2]WON73767.1 HAMP domain-containing sensor histidine kinase [Nitrosospira sp. Is2]